MRHHQPSTHFLTSVRHRHVEPDRPTGWFKIPSNATCNSQPHLPWTLARSRGPSMTPSRHLKWLIGDTMTATHSVLLDSGFVSFKMAQCYSFCAWFQRRRSKEEVKAFRADAANIDFAFAFVQLIEQSCPSGIAGWAMLEPLMYSRLYLETLYLRGFLSFQPLEVCVY